MPGAASQTQGPCLWVDGRLTRGSREGFQEEAAFEQRNRLGKMLRREGRAGRDGAEGGRAMVCPQKSRGGVRQRPGHGEAMRLPRGLNLAESNLIYRRFLEPWHVGRLAARSGSERPPRSAAVRGPASRADGLPPGHQAAAVRRF